MLSFPQAVPLQGVPTAPKNNFFLQNDSLQINFQWNQILSKNCFSTDKFQHNKPFCFLRF